MIKTLIYYLVYFLCTMECIFWQFELCVDVQSPPPNCREFQSNQTTFTISLIFGLNPSIEKAIFDCLIQEKAN